MDHEAWDAVTAAAAEEATEEVAPTGTGDAPTRNPGDRPVRIAVQLQPQHGEWARLRAAAVQAERLGVDAVFTWDHFFPLHGDPGGAHFECWTVLAAFAEATERVQIGALVTANSYRNPDLLADMARTVDHISGGRLILGIGAGWCQRDYDEYGYPFGTAGTRIDALGAALPRIEQRLGRLNPPPTGHIPVMIGGSGERKTLPLVARHADIWHSFGDLETFTAKSAVLDRWCAEQGRDPAQIERSVGAPDLRAGAALCAAGARLFTVSVSGPEWDLRPLHGWLAFRDEQNAARAAAAAPVGDAGGTG